jgi:hypothetical protein
MYRDALELRNFDYYMEDDWDGDGATAVTPLTLHNAKVILTALPIELQKGNAMAGTDGSIGLYWTDSESGITLICGQMAEYDFLIQILLLNGKMFYQRAPQYLNC